MSDAYRDAWVVMAEMSMRPDRPLGVFQARMLAQCLRNSRNTADGTISIAEHRRVLALLESVPIRCNDAAA
jgi:hypothetical protein